MSIITSTHTLAQVTCDDCGRRAADSEDCDYFWADQVDDGLTGTGWTVTDGQQFCEECSADQVCAQVGHDWEEWWTPTSDDWDKDVTDTRPRRLCRRFCRTGHQIADTSTDSRNGGEQQ